MWSPLYRRRGNYASAPVRNLQVQNLRVSTKSTQKNVASKSRTPVELRSNAPRRQYEIYIFCGPETPRVKYKIYSTTSVSTKSIKFFLLTAPLELRSIARQQVQNLQL